MSLSLKNIHVQVIEIFENKAKFVYKTIRSTALQLINVLEYWMEILNNKAKVKSFIWILGRLLTRFHMEGCITK